MIVELRVLSGARAGLRARFDREVVTLGRHPQNDLALHAELDRDVSSRHAEIRVTPAGEVLLADLGSTNGTLVNGTRVSTHRVHDGDVITLGPSGPKVEVRLGLAAGGAAAPAGHEGAASPAPPRQPTTERVAIAVEAHMSKLRVWGLTALGLLAVGVVGAYWAGARTSAAEVAEMRRMLAGYDSTTLLLRQQLRSAADTAAITRLNRTNDSLRAAATVASRGTSDHRAQIRERVSLWREGATAMSQVDLPAINDRNAPAIAYLVSEMDGQALGGTAFAITHGGLMLTNRHLVRTAAGSPATRLAVKFRDESEWISAHVVRTATAEDDDLALIQLDDAGRVPAVAGFTRNAAALREGAPVVTIGYPLGRATRMEGNDGDGFVARTSLYPGTISKSMPTLLQIAAFAGHGSSGSPVFDAEGLVAGVVWGGPRDSGGQLVYAVPASRVQAFLANQ